MRKRSSGAVQLSLAVESSATNLFSPFSPSPLFHPSLFRPFLSFAAPHFAHRQCPPAYLLPTFYLLDSISKNIGPPYLTLFSRFLERTFLSSYHAVDSSTKTKLEELLGTWKTGAGDGGELFRTQEEMSSGAGGEGLKREGRVQRGIENALWGGRGLAATTREGSAGYGNGVRSTCFLHVLSLLSPPSDALSSTLPSFPPSFEFSSAPPVPELTLSAVLPPFLPLPLLMNRSPSSPTPPPQPSVPASSTTSVDSLRCVRKRPMRSRRVEASRIRSMRGRLGH